MTASLKYILFDLDGTLLPLDQDLFIHTYLKKLAAKMSAFNYEPDKLVKAIWNGTSEMVRNDGSRTNEVVFWESFEKEFGTRVRQDMPVFDDFYRNEFQQISSICSANPQAAQCVHDLQKSGYGIVLATNPVFPAVATEARIRWAGFEPEEFIFYTTYENTSFYKPNPAYYTDIANRLNCDPKECLMVGNDVDEDMIASSVGMQVFLLSDCLLNRHNKDISDYPNGSYSELMEFISGEENGNRR